VAEVGGKEKQEIGIFLLHGIPFANYNTGTPHLSAKIFGGKGKAGVSLKKAGPGFFCFQN
jgi:hypothetical protein